MEKKSVAIHACPVTFTMSKIGGKWKPIILYLISQSTPERVSNRFGIMQRGIQDISKQMLTKQLRELEADGILSRKIYAEIKIGLRSPILEQVLAFSTLTNDKFQRLLDMREPQESE